MKLTVNRPRGAAGDLKSVFLRPVQLKAGFRLAFTYRHATKDLFKNHPTEEAITELCGLLKDSFRCSTLYTTEQTAELTVRDDESVGLVLSKAVHTEAPKLEHDRAKPRSIQATEPWLRELGVTQVGGRVREAMGDKFRQINQFTEVLRPLLAEAFPSKQGISVVDMGCGKGYLTFAVSQLLEQMEFAGSRVVGIEVRPALVDECNRVAKACGMDRLQFQAGSIASATLDAPDALIALHACDTATDDALARGVESGAQLIVVSPCCHKEVRPQIVPPKVLEAALSHGILLERQAEFVTDALRAALLEWAGYDTKVFEFISTEHTAKNLMLTAVKRRPRGQSEELAAKVRNLARFYGVKVQRLAGLLEFGL